MFLSDDTYQRWMKHPAWVAYGRLFAIEELAQSRPLQWLMAALLLGFYAMFHHWAPTPLLAAKSVAKNTYVCWPWFQQCHHFYVMQYLPEGYEIGIFQMVLLAIILFGVFTMFRRQWVFGHITMMVLFIINTVVLFGLTDRALTNLDVFQVVVGAIFLFSAHKLDFSRLAFVFLLFLEATEKLNDGWILGTFFTAVRYGMPVEGDGWAVVVGNSVLLSQMILSWGLLSSNRVFQRFSLAVFLVFSFVAFAYLAFAPSFLMVPLLLVLFGPIYPPLQLSLKPATILSWALISFALLAQFYRFTLPGDFRLTGQGKHLLFSDNDGIHQCASEFKIRWNTGTSRRITYADPPMSEGCRPYTYWFHLQQLCHRKKEWIDRVSWRLIHSVNGGPFFAIVDEPDACSLTYSPWGHNPWIRLPQAVVNRLSAFGKWDDLKVAPLVGYPSQSYREGSRAMRRM